MNGKSDFIVFSNGPGEISTWVYPIIERLKRDDGFKRDFKSYLIVHPCQFGSGTEHRYVEELKLFDYVVNPREYLKILFGLKSLKSLNLSRKGIIVSLGGDLMHPVLLRFRSFGKYRLFAYTNNPGWGRWYQRIFVRNDYVKSKAVKKGVPENKIIVTGDLVYSSIKSLKDRDYIRKALNLKTNRLMVLFLPGSRDFEVRYMLPVFLKVIEDLSTRIVNFSPFISKSPYVDFSLIDESLKSAYKIKEADTVGGKLVDLEDNTAIGKVIITDGGIKVPVLENGLEFWGKGVDLAVTLPGTNNIQLAYRGIPALVVAAMNKPEVIPIEGVAGLLKWIPGGKIVLRKAVKSYIKRFKYASLPNIYMDREIFPELFGVIKTADITKKLIELIRNNEIEKIKSRLAVFKLQNDPADLIISEIFK